MPLDPKVLEAYTTEALVAGLENAVREGFASNSPLSTHELIYRYLCSQLSAMCTLYANLYNQIEQVHLASVTAHRQLGEYSHERDQAIMALIHQVEELKAQRATH